MKTAKLNYLFCCIIFCTKIGAEVDTIDYLAYAFSSIQHENISNENASVADVQYAEESFKLLINEKGKNSIRESVKNRCETIKKIKQRMIEALNISDILPLDPLTMIPYKAVYRGNEGHPDWRLLPRERYVLDAIVGSTIFLQEIGCPEDQYQPYMDRDYELGEELVRQKLADDITKDFSLPNDTYKVYFIQAARQNATECVYRALENTVYALYALTQEKEKMRLLSSRIIFLKKS